MDKYYFYFILSVTFKGACHLNSSELEIVKLGKIVYLEMNFKNSY